MDILTLLINFYILISLLTIVPAMQFIGMHRISKSVFLEPVAANPQCTIIVKRAGPFTKAKHYILFLDGAQICTTSDEQMDLPPTVTIIPSIPSFFRRR